MSQITMKFPKQYYSASAGEHLVLGEILKRGTEAYLANGKTQPGWDIAVFNKHRNPLRVQVKAINWPIHSAVNGNFETGFDVIVIVLLNGNEKSRFLIIPFQDLEQFLSSRNQERKSPKRTLTIGKNFDNKSANNLGRYENCWEYIILTN